MMDGPKPSSRGKYGGDNELDRRYSAEQRDAGWYLMTVRRPFVSVLRIDMRDLVPERVDKICARNEYGAGVLFAGHGHMSKENTRGSTSSGKN